MVIDLDWHNPPEPKVAQQFKASIHRLHKGVWQPLTEPKAAIALFDAQASKTRKVTIVHDLKESDAADTIVSTRLRENRNVDLQEIEDFDIASQDGFIKFVLGRNPTVGADQPYVPTLASIRLGYIAEHVIHHDESIDRVLHIHPFGWTPYQPDIEDQSYLLPRYDGEGMLYLAFKDVVPPREVSILFQVIEGSADPDVSLPEIEWSYLSDDRWVTFADSQILEDSTNQFNRSGIVTLRLPAVDPGTGRLFSPDYYWVRAKTMTNANGACLVRDIRTQAATLLFVAPPDGAPRKLPLEANSIKEMAVAQAQVDAVNQPYPSFDGKPKEKDDQFYLRICERLRHKDRAVTLWDYERLVLEKFPSLYEAQCFKHFNPEDGYSPGSVLMVVIADIRHHVQRDPFKPTTSLDRLDQVKRYLESVCPPYLRIEVKNPVFEEIRLSFLVKFKGEANPGYYQQQLDQAIQHHLSPWAFDEVGEIKFGSTVYKSSLLHFVEEQPYVDIVTYFDMDHADANGNLKVNVEEATATTPISVLVSAKSHHITVIQDQSVICAEGIGFMIIEQTFKVRGIRDTFISIEEGIGYMKLEDDFKIIADNKT